MTPIRIVAVSQLACGWALARHPTAALRLLRYPEDGLVARTTVRALGARQLAQGTVELRGGTATTAVGAGVDLLHAVTCLIYAHNSSRGRLAGRRSAALALLFAATQAAAALRTPATGERVQPPSDTSPARPARSILPHVASATGAAWPEPVDHDLQQVQVGTTQETPVLLCGGVMDGAVVAVGPGIQHYDVFDSDHGPQRYRATRERDARGRVIFTRGLEDEP
jgi:hypothetical protein